MKTLASTIILLLTLFVAPAAETPRQVAPGVKSSYDVAQGKVQKIYSANQGGNRFVAYVVKWNNVEIIVSDPLARSSFKVGDTISFLAQRVNVDAKTDAVRALSFTLTDRPPAGQR